MPEKILIIDDDLDTLRLVGLMLQRQGYQIVAANNGPQGLEQAQAQVPDLIILDVMMPNMDGYEVARHLRGNPVTATVPILMFTAKIQIDDKVAGFESGADDYLTKPVHPTELQAHVRALLSRSIKKGTESAPTIPIEKPAFVIGVLSARGGLGVTTVGLNLACSLFQKTKQSVIFAEMRPGQGTIAIDLNISQSNGLVELLELPAAQLTREAVKEHLATHESGLQLLTSSFSPRDAALASTSLAQAEVVVNRLESLARYVVLDLGSSLNAMAQKLIPGCHLIIVVAEPMTSSVVHTQSLLFDLAALGVEKKRTFVVLNYRMRSDLQLSVNQVMDKLGHAIAVTFTSAPELIFQAARKNTTAFFAQPEGLTGQQYITLTNQIIERVPK